MKVFLAGGSGAIGRRLIPLLVDAGHEVAATTRTWGKARMLYELGADPVVLDALDRDAVVEAVVRAEPEVVVHQLTALADLEDLKDFDRVFAPTNRLRSEGTDNLLAAARAAGARRIVAQSYGHWNYARTGGAVKKEDDPIDPAPPESMRVGLSALVHLESVVTGADDIEGLALRFGGFYGPGTSLAEDGPFLGMVRKRKLPLIGEAAGVWSFVHIDDAAGATLAAVEQGEPGIYNVADDEPAPANVWLPELARIIGAKPPRHVPVWLGRRAAGDAVVVMFTEARGISNAKAKRELDWHLRYPTWREGFRTALGADAADARTERSARA